MIARTVKEAKEAGIWWYLEETDSGNRYSYAIRNTHTDGEIVSMYVDKDAPEEYHEQLHTLYEACIKVLEERF